MDKPRVLYIYKFDSHRKYSCEATPLPLEEFSVVKELTNNTFALQFGNLSGGIRSRFDNAPKKNVWKVKKKVWSSNFIPCFGPENLCGE